MLLTKLCQKDISRFFFANALVVGIIPDFMLPDTLLTPNLVNKGLVYKGQYTQISRN